MNRERKPRRRRPDSKPNSQPEQRPRELPGSGYRDYLKRCEFSGVDPVEFPEFLKRAQRWRKEYGPARDRGDFSLMQELEALLCV